MSTPLILPDYARGPLIVRHETDGRYVSASWNAIASRTDECEACHYSFEEKLHPVRTYRDASDVFDLCDECLRDGASTCELVEDPDDTSDVIPAVDYLSWADFDTVESLGHDGSGRGLY